MPQALEDPRKTDMRERCVMAIDAAGYELVSEPASLRLEDELEWAVKGDLQSLDGEEVRHAYYLRPDSAKPAPQWLVTIAAAVRDRTDLEVFIVVNQVSSTLEKSCRASGVGLLRLTDDNTFELIVDPASFDPAAVQAELKERIRDARRRMETKLGQIRRSSRRTTPALAS